MPIFSIRQAAYKAETTTMPVIQHWRAASPTAIYIDTPISMTQNKHHDLSKPSSMVSNGKLNTASQLCYCIRPPRLGQPYPSDQVVSTYVRELEHRI